LIIIAFPHQTCWEWLPVHPALRLATMMATGKSIGTIKGPANLLNLAWRGSMMHWWQICSTTCSRGHALELLHPPILIWATKVTIVILVWPRSGWVPFFGSDPGRAAPDANGRRWRSLLPCLLPQTTITNSFDVDLNAILQTTVEGTQEKKLNPCLTYNW
jgi:hypothetical protein